MIEFPLLFHCWHIPIVFFLAVLLFVLGYTARARGTRDRLTLKSRPGPYTLDDLQQIRKESYQQGWEERDREWIAKDGEAEDLHKIIEQATLMIEAIEPGYPLNMECPFLSDLSKLVRRVEDLDDREEQHADLFTPKS